ncbi:LysR family transcriptional regulator [Agarivorans sp. Toyoura001]|uniref:LysR family transcriptional regulator n=1 Tax=Agarivorans sp. Toyoura001 TaxID=2283141 RepID=UPI0010CFF1C0|nr:LysR family transcriptional regulator [Agarivorans sp. Toyoura001]GDY24877.1 LysR family transcriptional regulator [Agarivorans sp. Toyoura001]
MINLDWLQTYCTLVETGHFTRTAEKLAMTQPGVSQQIRKLEDHFQTPLLQREGKSFNLTEAGHKVYQQAQITLAQLSGLEVSLKQDDPHTGLCRIASPGSLGLKLYPSLLDLQQQYPKLVFDYQFAPNARIEQLLAERQLDLGFITRPSQLSELSAQVFAKEALLLVTPASCNKPNWQALQNLGYIDHPDGAHHANLLLSANYPEFEQLEQFRLQGFSNQISLILEPVSRSLGFTVLPAHAVAAFSEPSKIAIHHLAKPVDETIYLVQRRYQQLASRFKLVSQIMQQGLTANDN